MRWIRWIAVVSVICSLAAPCVASEADSIARAQNKVTKGNAKLQNDDFRSAERLFRKAIEIEPALPTAHLGLGAALIGQQRYGDALVVLDETERRFAEYDEMNKLAAVKAQDMVEEARRQVETLEDTYGVFHQVPTQHGLDANVIGRWHVEQGGSTPAQTYYLQGIALVRTGQRSEGMQKLEHCLLLDKDHGLAHYNLAVALLAEGRPTEAMQHLDQAVAAGVEPAPAFVSDLERMATK